MSLKHRQHYFRGENPSHWNTKPVTFDLLQSFWRFLFKKALPGGSLSRLDCAVLGLGDSSYPKWVLHLHLHPQGLVGLLSTLVFVSQVQLRGQEAAQAAAAARRPRAAARGARRRPARPRVRRVCAGAAGGCCSELTLCLLQGGGCDRPLARGVLGAAVGSVPASGRRGPAEGRRAVSIRCLLLWGGRVFGLKVCSVFSGRLPPTYTFHFLDDVAEKTEEPRAPTEQGAPAQPHPFPARMVFNRRVTEPSHFQDVRHIEFDISGSDVECVTAAWSFLFCLWSLNVSQPRPQL